MNRAARRIGLAHSRWKRLRGQMARLGRYPVVVLVLPTLYARMPKTNNEDKDQNEKERADGWAARHEASLKHRPSGRGRNSLVLLHGRILA
jgi:hypothetical protein